MSDQPTTTEETPRRFRSKTAANVARRADHTAAVKKADEEYVAAGIAFLADLNRRIAPGFEKLREIAALHMPYAPTGDTWQDTLECPKCNDGSSYDPERDDFPCETMAVIVRGLDLPPAPRRHRPTMPDLADYWPDPCVIVTFEKQVLLTDKETGFRYLLNPGEQQTLKHSLAYELRSELTLRSRERVEAMA